MNCIELSKARQVFANGGNVTEFLRAETGQQLNTSEIIEIAYDLQAGSYIKGVKANWQKALERANEISSYLEQHLTPEKKLLDVGTGELTTLCLMLKNATIIPTAVFAFDISWSRLYKGMDFWRENLQPGSVNFFPFVADMKSIPFPANSIDIVTSNHALEPNGGNVSAILKELFRVCRDRLVLFEPSYEMNSDTGRARMDKLGYIKDLETEAAKLGGKLLDVTLMETSSNPLNPTACYVIEPPPTGQSIQVDSCYSVPGTDYLLVQNDGQLSSVEAGLVFPVLKGIPVLKEQSAILATSFI